MKKLLLPLVASLVLLVGCAGTAFKWDQARQIKSGMTDTELVAVMGPPYMVSVGADGQQMYQWVYADIYGLSGGTRTLTVMLKDNKVTTAPVIPASFK